jgi:hypothetical protein
MRRRQKPQTGQKEEEEKEEKEEEEKEKEEKGQEEQQNNEPVHQSLLFFHDCSFLYYSPTNSSH